MVSDYIGTLENVSITRRTTSMKYNILNKLGGTYYGICSLLVSLN